MSSVIIIANTTTFVVWIYFQRARDDDEFLARIIIRDSPSVTGFAETKAKDGRKCLLTRWEAFITGSEGDLVEILKFPRTMWERIRSIRWFQPVAKRRWCSEESIVAVSWWKNYSDGWPEVRASRSVIARARERRAVEDITRRRVRYTRAGPRGKIMPEEVGICLFFPCLLWPRTQVPMIAFVSLREPRKERDVSLEKPTCSSSFEEPWRRSWSWLKYRHKWRKLRASEIENIVYFEQVSSHLK